MLNLAPGFASAQIRSLSDAFGDPREVMRADTETLQRRGGLSPKAATRLASFSWEAALEAEFQRADGLGVRIRTVEDEGEYPVQLREIYDPPPVLYVLGRLLAEEGCPVAVVGARRPTSYGRRMARILGRDLAQRGCTVVSGMARGVTSRPTRGPWRAADGRWPWPDAVSPAFIRPRRRRCRTP